MTQNDKFIDGLSRRPKLRANSPHQIDGIMPRQIGFSQTRKKRQPESLIRNQIRTPLSNQEKFTPLFKINRDLKNRETRHIGVEKIVDPEEIAEDFVQPVGSFNLDCNNSPAEIKPAKQEKKKGFLSWIFRHKILMSAIILVLVAGGVFYLWGNNVISKLTGGKSNLFDAIKSVVIDETKPLEMDTNGRTNILAFGTSGYDMGGSGHDGAQLTDSIMVISLDQKTKEVVTLSLPRDLKVAEACYAGKINEVYECNSHSTDEIRGAEALKKVVERVLGLNIHYRVHVNWGALIQLVDTIGGITVTLDETIADAMTNTYIKAGETVNLNGEKALGLARARYGTTHGDFSRGNSQQKILAGIGEKILKNQMDLTKILNLINILGDNLRTNLSMDELKTGFRLMKDFDTKNIRQLSLIDTDEGNLMSTATINGVSVVIPSAGVNSFGAIQSYVARELSSNKAVREKAQILVLNGSSLNGVASLEKTNLERMGLTVKGIGNTKTEYENKYYLYDLTRKNPGTLEILEEKYSTKALLENIPSDINTEGVDFIVILGNG